MPYSPAEAMRTSSWRLRMAYSPEYVERHHPVWHEEMEKKKAREEASIEKVIAFPHALLDKMAAD
ncbi:MAG: hypothetical protein QG639_219 [Patescibacteria group bacterium]|nr:hypothetical protein [Patescibacteria group bacterium]